MRIWPTLGAALVLLVIVASAGLALNPSSTEASSVVPDTSLLPQEVLLVDTETEPGGLLTADPGSIPLRQPACFRLALYLDEGQYGGESEAFDVPADQWLVIETISAQGDLNGGSQFQRGGLRYGDSHEMYFGPTCCTEFEQLGSACSTWTATHPCRLYVEPGQQVSYFLGRTGPEEGCACATVWISGYFTDQVY